MIDFGPTLRRVAALFVCAGFAGLASCQAPALDPEADAVARAVYSEIRTQSPSLQARLSPEIRTPQTAEELVKVRAYIPAGEPSLGKAVGWNYLSMVGKGKTATLAHEYDYPGKVVLARVALARPEGAKAWLMTGFNAQVATMEELKALKFSLAGKHYTQYVFLAGLAASLGLMLAALIKVIRIKGLKRKWLWGIAAFAGVGSLQMNWFNAVFSWKLVNIALLGAGVVRGGSRFDPWILTFIVPLGAVLILTGVWAKPKAEPVVEEAF
ncbi:hypothetical protein [Caulobacter sp. DWP3-1-3b2]|uniref:hypothetical protein n=1 Tax=Caulobacter sp. DWP3-1-3b2 TaxID=2804643 RepID=UPI003CEE6E87